jgi:hypothetical protein
VLFRSLSAAESGTKAESSFSQGVYKREDREADPAESNIAADKEPVFQRVRVSSDTELTFLRKQLSTIGYMLYDEGSLHDNIHEKTK